MQECVKARCSATATPQPLSVWVSFPDLLRVAFIKDFPRLNMQPLSARCFPGAGFSHHCLGRVCFESWLLCHEHSFS